MLSAKSNFGWIINKRWPVSYEEHGYGSFQPTDICELTCYSASG
jgi:hypothetical protein